jgi:SP family sugar:H+ symporter-like MFS transporter
LIAAVIVNATKDMQSKASYQIPIGLQFVWGAIIVGGVLMLPESPRWLLAKGKEEEGRRSLSKLLGVPEDSEALNVEYAEIMGNLEHERQYGAGSWADCFKSGPGKNRQRVLTGMGIQAIQQLTVSRVSFSN